jgi:type IV pilus assembly protein PilP
VNERLRAVAGLMGYVVAGLLALVTASLLSTHFMGRALSQTNSASPPPGVAPAPQPPTAPAAPAANAGAAAPNSGAPAQNGGAAKTNGKYPSALADVLEDFNYSPVGKRDPFQPYERPLAGAMQGPLWPLQRFDLDQLKLVGIIWDVRDPKAMILDPSGKGYVVKVNERIGRNNGYIARIREGEIIVVESATGLDGKLVYTTKLMKLTPEAE